MSYDKEFRDSVVASLARLETQMASVEGRTSAQEKSLADVARFQHRVLGALSAVSVLASALVSFSVSAAKHIFSEK